MYSKNTHSLVLSAMLSVIALLLSFISFAVPFLPPFLKFDFAFIPLFIALFLLGYKYSLLVSFLKNFLYFVMISHEPTGSIANIAVEFIFLTIIVLFYKKEPIKIILGGALATIAVTIFMSFFNYFVLLPAYGYIMDLSDIINNLRTIVTAGIIPFNILKGILLIFLLFFSKRIYTALPKSIKNKF